MNDQSESDTRPLPTEAATRGGRIYHLAPASELRAGCTRDDYSPARLADDGFVHCTGTPAVTLSVAADYFADLEETLYVLQIDPSKLDAELRFEAPAPIAGGGRAHLDRASVFPHVYGPIDRGAIDGAACLVRGPRGFQWPARFESLDDVVAPR